MSQQKPLMEVLEEVSLRIKQLEAERDEAIARAQAREREVTELVSLINRAASKLEEMLEFERTSKAIQPKPIDLPTPYPDMELFHEFSADPERAPRERTPNGSDQRTA